MIEQNVSEHFSQHKQSAISGLSFRKQSPPNSTSRDIPARACSPRPYKAMQQSSVDLKLYKHYTMHSQSEARLIEYNGTHREGHTTISYVDQ